MLRLGVGERGVTEIMGLAEHVAGLCAGAAGLEGIDPVSTAEGGQSVFLAEIREWSAAHLGRDELPWFWAVLAHQPKLLEATWRKDRLVMGAGVLDEAAKACVALGVAVFKQSQYWIDYLGRLVRSTAGLDEAGMVELVGGVMHYVSFNTISHGMGLEPPYSEMTAASFTSNSGSRQR